MRVYVIGFPFAGMISLPFKRERNKPPPQPATLLLTMLLPSTSKKTSPIWGNCHSHRALEKTGMHAKSDHCNQTMRSCDLVFFILKSHIVMNFQLAIGVRSYIHSQHFLGQANFLRAWRVVVEFSTGQTHPFSYTGLP